MKNIILEMNLSTGINAIKTMIQKNQRGRAYKLLHQLVKAPEGAIHFFRGKTQNIHNENITLLALYSLSKDSIQIEFTYENIQNIKRTEVPEKFIYDLEHDIIQSESFSKNIQLPIFSRNDAVFIVNCIKKINPSTSVKLQDFKILQYEQKVEISKSNDSSPIDGMKKRQTVNYIYKKFDIQNRLRGFFNDDSWSPINLLIGELQKNNINIEIDKTEYYKDNNQNPAGKVWYGTIPFTNQNNRPDKLHYTITAAGAGSVNDPLSRYDCTFVIS